MGRPLKIAKAQAVLTITDTTAATGAVTVSQWGGNAGVAYMPYNTSYNLVVTGAIEMNNVTINT